MEIRKIPLSLVKTSPMNPRKTFDEDEIQELADNIEKQGLLQPITVRPVIGSSQFAVIEGKADFFPNYEIVCGERRYRAFNKLSEKWSEMDRVTPEGEPHNRFSDIACIVREMSDDEAFDAMITENLQRKDVDPIEEAFAFSQIIQKGKTAEDVALRFGKSVRFVQDRVKLNNLIPELMLAVRDDKMSISSAMMIAKLDEEDQRKFHSQYEHSYQGYSKAAAESFINGLFLNIDKALWYDNNPDFEGGCGRKCSSCVNNTANHGCLFREMKSQDAGRCTSRNDFQSKTLAYILNEADKISDTLVRKGEPLEFGKTVLCLRDDYINSSVQKLADELKRQIEDRGFEIVDPAKVFQSRCFYDMDDERTLDFLKQGKVYRCINLFNYSAPMLQHEVWYLKKDDHGTNAGKDGTPYQVTEILNGLKDSERGLKSSYAVEGAEALARCTPKEDPLTDDEKVLMLSFMLVNNFTLQKIIGLNMEYDPETIRTYVAEHPQVWNQIMHGWVFTQMHERHPCLKIGEGLLDDLGKVHCPEEYQKAKDTVLAKFNKNKSKAEKKLKDLGYGLDGKPLSKTAKVKLPQGKDILSQYKVMKKKHPDCILLFRVGDFYECFYEDAEEASKILGITLTTTKGRKLAGFPHHALDTYLPKIIKAGKRVAICEQPEAPGKSK